MTRTSYRVDVSSPPEFEELVAEIFVDDQFVGLLSQEQGPERTVFELGPIDGSLLKIDLAVFEAALAHAKLRLFEMMKRRT